MPTLTTCQTNPPPGNDHRATKESWASRPRPASQPTVARDCESQSQQFTQSADVSRWLRRLEHLTIRSNVVVDARTQIESGNIDTKQALDAALDSMIDDLVLMSASLPASPPGLNSANE